MVEVVSAYYGTAAAEWNVAARLRESVQRCCGGALALPPDESVSKAMGGDPAPGRAKRLRLLVRLRPRPAAPVAVAAAAAADEMGASAAEEGGRLGAWEREFEVGEFCDRWIAPLWLHPDARLCVPLQPCGADASLSLCVEQWLWGAIAAAVSGRALVLPPRLAAAFASPPPPPALSVAAIPAVSSAASRLLRVVSQSASDTGVERKAGDDPRANYGLWLSLQRATFSTTAVSAAAVFYSEDVAFTPHPSQLALADWRSEAGARVALDALLALGTPANPRVVARAAAITRAALARDSCYVFVHADLPEPTVAHEHSDIATRHQLLAAAEAACEDRESCRIATAARMSVDEPRVLALCAGSAARHWHCRPVDVERIAVASTLALTPDEPAFTENEDEWAALEWALALGAPFFVACASGRGSRQMAAARAARGLPWRLVDAGGPRVAPFAQCVDALWDRGRLRTAATVPGPSVAVRAKAPREDTRGKAILPEAKEEKTTPAQEEKREHVAAPTHARQRACENAEAPVYGVYHLCTIGNWREVQARQWNQLRAGGLAARTTALFVAVTGPEAAHWAPPTHAAVFPTNTGRTAVPTNAGRAAVPTNAGRAAVYNTAAAAEGEEVGDVLNELARRTVVVWRSTDARGYERHALQFLAAHALAHAEERDAARDAAYYYFHSKGVSALHAAATTGADANRRVLGAQATPASPQDRVADWARALGHHVLVGWARPLCALRVLGFDVVGVNLETQPYVHSSGNFWWARRAWVRRAAAAHAPSPYYLGPELWLCSGAVAGEAPRVLGLWHSHVYHYSTPFPAAALLPHRSASPHSLSATADRAAITGRRAEPEACAGRGGKESHSAFRQGEDERPNDLPEAEGEGALLLALVRMRESGLGDVLPVVVRLALAGPHRPSSDTRPSLATDVTERVGAHGLPLALSHDRQGDGPGKLLGDMSGIDMNERGLLAIWLGPAPWTAAAAQLPLARILVHALPDCWKSSVCLPRYYTEALALDRLSRAQTSRHALPSWAIDDRDLH